ncbi:MAG: hypothetical protein OIF58_10165 [Cohaesibacter sp.]|nr:hypothetical protein [Cohaesibacter sp.]
MERPDRQKQRAEAEQDGIWRVPPLWLVVGCWCLALGSGLVLFVHLLPALQTLAGGRLPDQLPFGYSLEDARGIVYHLGPEGRQAVQSPYLLLDIVFALGLSSALCTSSLRLMGYIGDFGNRFARLLPVIAVVMPILAGLFDLWENWQIWRMMELGLDIRQGDIASLIRATSFKFGFYLSGISAFIILFVIKLLHKEGR